MSAPRRTSRLGSGAALPRPPRSSIGRPVEDRTPVRAFPSLALRARSAYMRGNGPRSGRLRHGQMPCGRAAQPEGRTPNGMNFQGQHRSAAEKAEPVQHDPAAAPRKSRRSRYAWIGTAASVVLFAVSLGVLWKLVQSVSWAEVRTAIKAATFEQLGLAFLFVGISHPFLTRYDALGLR